MIEFRQTPKFDKDAVCLFFHEEEIKGRKYTFKNKSIMDELSNLIKSKQFTGKNGELFPLVLNGQIFLFVGLGEEHKASSTAIRVAARKAFTSSYLSKIKSVEVQLEKHSNTCIKAVIEAALIGTYVWKKYKSADKKDDVGNRKYFFAVPAGKDFTATATICEGVNLTRDLVNENAEVATSIFIESVIKDLVKNQKNITLEILNEKELKAKGLYLHLAVNRASNKEPKLIIVKYNGGGAKDEYTAVLGKGMTFDTGGINLKPSGHIETMRMDMSGAGAVVGILKNVLALKLRKNIIFAVGMAENAIGSNAYLPGDVFTGYGGKSVEIGNTDAEGRLVLADAIAYLVKNYKPQRIIDMATLTGACVVALGFDYTGLFSNNDKLAAKLLDSAAETDDRAWRLPIYPEISEYIKSPVADLKNTSNVKGGGACTAAEFLHQFVDGTDWAHLDIAGTAFVDGSNRMYFAHGATGAGVRLLTHYLMNN